MSGAIGWLGLISGAEASDAPPQLSTGLSVMAGAGVLVGAVGAITAGAGADKFLSPLDRGEIDGPALVGGAALVLGGGWMVVSGAVLGGTATFAQSRRVHAEPWGIGFGLMVGSTTLVVSTIVEPSLGLVVGVPVLGLSVLCGTIAQGTINRTATHVAALPFPLRDGAGVAVAAVF